MLSGGRSQFVALKARMPWIDINQERHHAYAGYEGMVELVKQIDKSLYNPIWEQVRRPAPWDEGTRDVVRGTKVENRDFHIPSPLVPCASPPASHASDKS
jgi:hypothetical protein